MRRTTTKIVAISAAWSSLLVQLQAQQPFVEKLDVPILWRPYTPRTPSPVTMTNSDRVHALIRAGRLYLTLQDAIALAVENNLDLQVDRYGPLNADWNLARAEAGGPLKGVTSGNSVVNTVVSGQGVAGAIQAAGLSQGVSTGSVSSNNGTISQIGPITPNLDPVFQNTSAWGHQTQPQANPQIAGTNALVNTTHVYQSQVQEGSLTGGYARLSMNESYLSQNAPTNTLNPSEIPQALIRIRHNLLNGFGLAVNSRFIRIAKKGLTSANVTFRAQLDGLVQNVVDTYWDLATASEDLHARQLALATSQKFFEDTSKEIDLGAVAKVDIYRAQADLSSRKQDVAIAQESTSQLTTQLKSLITRVPDPMLDAAEIVTLDKIEVPASDDLPPLRDLVAKALANRPDVAIDRLNQESSEISAIGTVNNLLPTLQVAATITNTGLAGQANPGSGKVPHEYQIGGYGTAIGQVFRNDYASRLGQVYFFGTIHNRSAQGDYGVDQLTLRQNDLLERRNRNQMVVDISNQMIAVRQARSRYLNAVATRQLQQNLLEKERQKFSLGSSTIDLVIAAERTLSAAQYTEIGSLSAYSRARVALDQVLGLTLEANHVSIDEALTGKVGRESKLPETLPAASAPAARQ
ncbi:MAG: TolC family protein [Acidobacteriia bacterium]|nr:TolC family protein [Terriglobia bacterium]